LAELHTDLILCDSRPKPEICFLLGQLRLLLLPQEC